MNKAIELFGNHIYKVTQNNPQKALKQLSFVYTAAGLQCKYFPSKLLLPARNICSGQRLIRLLSP